MSFRLRADIPKDQLPQCDHMLVKPMSHQSKVYRERLNRRYEAKGFEHDRCRRGGKFQIQGKCYCDLHAGAILITMVESGEIVLP